MRIRSCWRYHIPAVVCGIALIAFCVSAETISGGVYSIDNPTLDGSGGAQGAGVYSVLTASAQAGECGPVSGGAYSAIYGVLAGGGLPYISPAIPDLSTDENVPMTYNLWPHMQSPNGFPAGPNWTITPAETDFYTATISTGNVLTVTPKTNASG
jgi:hypothetical protein